ILEDREYHVAGEAFRLPKSRDGRRTHTREAAAIEPDPQAAFTVRCKRRNFILRSTALWKHAELATYQACKTALRAQPNGAGFINADRANVTGARRVETADQLYRIVSHQCDADARNSRIHTTAFAWCERGDDFAGEIFGKCYEVDAVDADAH